ncbi:phosphatase PAP2 family protein [Methylocaldum sp.]|uniref:phosphatase PAP2 family protein n=1 Tax=Methylocaldum sp. TaxID=1969727 RepID=UPI002D455F2A|nr:phosphatase PAP2 family protein [Methylocaldum sp.]HYE35441.1 phosphatase PAP2 family protein [Methylocaldum sp.]
MLLLLHLALPLGVLALSLILVEVNGWDVALSDRYFDAATDTFPMRHDVVFDLLLHDAANWVLRGVALATVLLLIASFFLRRLVIWRRALVYLLVSTGISIGSVALLKQHTTPACPWSVERYGGTVPHYAFTDLRFVSKTEAGRCWPGGHAAGGFSLLALYYVVRVRRPRTASVVLLFAFVFGCGLAWSQVVRGAHFLSHNLWSLAICWTTATILAWSMGVRPKDGYGESGTRRTRPPMREKCCAP